MSDQLMLDVDQAGELKAAFRREKAKNGEWWTNGCVKKLCEQKGLLGQVLDVLLGYAEIKLMENIIDTSADPFCPNGWKVEEHLKAGKLAWNPAKVRLHLDPGQQNGKCEGNKLRKALKSQPVLNACVLDWLLAHPELIPEEWKDEYIYFWGTIYRNGDLCVRYLYWDGGAWGWTFGWLGCDCYGNDPAAVSAS